MLSRLDKMLRENLRKINGSREERQRLIVFAIATFSIVLGLLLQIFGIWGVKETVFKVINVVLILVVAVILFICYKKRLKVICAFALLAVTMQLTISLKIVLIASDPYPDISMIYANELLSFILIELLVLGFVYGWVTWLITLIGSATCVFVMLTMDMGTKFNMFQFFMIAISVVTSFLGFLLWKSMHYTEDENKYLKGEEQFFLRRLGISHDELVAFMTMSHDDKHKDKNIKSFFDNVDDRIERNIVEAVRKRDLDNQMENVEIEKIFPMLSETEQEVCRLIMYGKTLKEIAVLLDKSVGNISSVRIHIRKKFGLKTSQDLREYLMEHMGKAK